ncbi:hypothetical protein ACIBG8_27860 [Nonomuraea sp. NPDC050556]|uniref:hypothetical protein n=1 Tax=Nonomuraea sp. NPDC050556 TaxID=3364369 RepID=UPI0037902DBE
MSSRKILALAVLTAGASWLAVVPAQAATECKKSVAVLEAPATAASLCDEVTDVRATGTYGGKMSAPADSELLSNVDMLAAAVGLPGLSRAAAVLSIADLAGVAAGTGLPTLPAGLPYKAGLADVSSLALLPDVPGMPAVPTVKLPVAELPEAQDLTRVLPKPVAEIEKKATTVLPDVVKKPELPAPGLDSLLDGLNLG